MLEPLASHFGQAPPMARLAVGMAPLAGVPVLCRRLHLPRAVGFLLAGVLFGPRTRDSSGQRLFDEPMLNAVLVMLVVTTVVGLVLTELLCAADAEDGGR